MASCAKVLLSEYITIGLQSLKNVLLGVPKKMISWLVLDEVHLNRSVKSAKFWKNEYFPYLWAFLQRSMSAFSQNSCLSGLDFEDSLVQSDE